MNRFYNPAEHQISRANVTHLRRLWTYPASGASYDGVPIIVGQTVYVTQDAQSLNGSVVALSLSSGKPLWRTKIACPLEKLSYSGSSVFVLRLIPFPKACTSGATWGKSTQLAVLDAKTGKTKWTADSGYGILSPPSAGGGELFMQYFSRRTGETSIQARRISDGHLNWAVPADENVPIVAGNTLLLTGIIRPHTLAAIAVDASSGRRLWTSSLNAIWPKSVDVSTGQVYLGGGTGTDAVSLTDGHLLWSTATETDVVGQTALFGQCPPMPNGWQPLCAINPVDGSPLWTSTTPTSYTAAANGVVYAETDVGTVGFNSTSGAPLGTVVPDGFNPVVAAGHLLVDCNQGICAYGP